MMNLNSKFRFVEEVMPIKVALVLPGWQAVCQPQISLKREEKQCRGKNLVGVTFCA